MFPEKLYDFLTRNTLVEIKGGRTRPGFLKIWMVEVDGRLFSRSWNKSERSWFTEFSNTGLGQIKYGEEILNVKGKKLEKEDPVHQKINEAYLKKYTQPENLKYAQDITKPGYADYTIEFFME